MADLRTRAAEHGNPADPSDSITAVDGLLTDPRPVPLRTPSTLPDLDQSGIVADMDVSVYVAWTRVMGEVQWIAKSGRADKYNFRGIDQIRNAVGPALRKHGVIVLPISTRIEHERVSRSGGGTMTTSWAVVRYAVFGPRGDRLGGPDFFVETAGEGFDVGDKSTMKAESVAERTFYIAGLAIPTDQPEMDPEHGKQYEIAVPPRPTADDYHKRAVNPETSVPSLRAMGQELSTDPETANKIVTDMDGAQIKLIDLVRRIWDERRKS